MPKNFYEIRIKGCLDANWATWFSGLEIRNVGEDEILLSGEFQDQSALYGLLAQICGLNLTLISVQRVETPSENLSI